MATFVLVAGAWLGGWCWQPIARRLREHGHDAHPVTLTGLGERVHLARPEINLDTHITDIVNLIEYEDLHDVILLGHSYAGVPATGAADRVPERVALLVYLDSAPIPGGMAYLDTFPPEAREFTERQAAERGDGWRLPMPSWEELETINGASLEGVGERERGLMRARGTAQPLGTYTQPLRRTGTAQYQMPKLAILNTITVSQVRELIDAGHPFGRVVAGPEWRFVELPTGHWPMFSAPDALASLLHGLSQGATAVQTAPLGTRA